MSDIGVAEIPVDEDERLRLAANAQASAVAHDADAFATQMCILYSAFARE